MSFIHLHNHSHYSILEGLPKPGDYVKRAKELGMEAIRLTDTNNIHGAFEFYQAAKKEGIKPIIGTEIFIKSTIDDTMYHKLVLLAKNHNGFNNITSLLSWANLNHKSNPHITIEKLREYSSDLIGLSGPISGEIPYYILAGLDEDKIVLKIEEFEEIFDGDFYIELLYHDDIPKQKLVTNTLIDLHNKYGFKVIAAQNTYYIDKSDKATQDIIMALGTGHVIANPDRNTLINGDYSFLSSEDMSELFGFIPSAISNTKEIADKINIEIESGNILIPKYELPDHDQKIFEEAMELRKEEKGLKDLTSEEWYLRYLSFSGLNLRYNYGLTKQELFNLVKKLDKSGLQKPLTESSPKELEELSLTYYSDDKKKFLDAHDKDFIDKINRLEYELVVVHEMGFDRYFLIVADYISWAKSEGIPVGPGRGSARGSLMAYLTQITDIDPLKYDLLFERFLNPRRISMPDIDTDFRDNERDKVINYCREKYGADHVAQICTFGTFARRARVKDVGRVMGLEFAEMNELAKLIPEKPGIKLKDALVESLEFKDAYENNPKYKEIIDNALKIEGNVRQIGVHACRVLIAPKSITNYTALDHPPKDNHTIITQYSAHPLEDLGLLKMDFLGLRNLTIIKRALKIIKNTKGVDVDILNIPMDDKQALDIFCAGDTTGVFQFESDGMRKYLMDLQPSLFEDLIAMVSLYRPGPLAYIPDFIKRKHGIEEITYMTGSLIEILQKAGYSENEILEEKQRLEDDLKSILDITYGIAVYQEQLMFMVQSMAGFSLGEADLLRRGVGKKIKEIIEQIKIDFVKRAVEYRGYKPETPKYIYEEMIEPRANYSFNKSHARCYALIAYQTRYLKAHYKTEFLVAMMVSDEENLDRMTLEVGEAQSSGIEVLPPSVNESMKHFTYIDDKTIRFGLKAIKGIGNGPIEAIIEGRQDKKYTSIDDFLERAGRDVVNKKSLESLSLSGGLDELGDRGVLYKNVPNIIKYFKDKEKKLESNQIGLFDNLESENTLQLEEFESFKYEELINYEREVLGFSVSGHPLDGLLKYSKKRSKNDKILRMSLDEYNILDDEKKNNRMKSETIGYIKDIRKVLTKTGGSMMFLYCENFYYDFEITIFPKDFDRFRDIAAPGEIVIVSGQPKINVEFGRKSILAYDLKTITITKAREQAESMNLLDESKFGIFRSSLEFSKSRVKKKTDVDINDGEIEIIIDDEPKSNTQASTKPRLGEYIINIPPTTNKEYLHKLKKMMLELPSGDIKIFLELKGQKIDTKISLKDLDDIYRFEQSYFT